MGAYDNSVDKELHLYFMTKDEMAIGQVIPTYTFFEQIDNATYTDSLGTHEGGIVAESMSLTMGLLESAKFELGSYVLPEMQVTVFYHGQRYKNKLVRAWITQEDDVNLYGIICGEVHQESLSDDRQTITLTIRNILYNTFTTYVDWADFFASGSQTELYAIKSYVTDIYADMIRYTYSYACGVYNKSDFDTVVSSGIITAMLGDMGRNFADFNWFTHSPELNVITKLAKPFDDDLKSYSLGQIWKWFGELAGVHWIIDKPLYSSMADIEATTIQINTDFAIKAFRIKEINALVPNNNVFPSDSLKPLTGLSDADFKTIPYYVSCIYDEFMSVSYSYATYKNTSLSIQTTATPSLPYEFSGGNPFFDYAYLKDTQTPSYAPQALAWWENAQNLKGAFSTQKVNDYLLNLNKIMYATLDCQYDCEVKLGDNLIVELNDNFVSVIPVISYEVNGINDLRVTYKTTAIKES